MARAHRHETKSQEAAQDKRQARDKKQDKGKKGKKPKQPGGGTQPGTVTESLKAKSTQTGDQAMNAVPGSYPAEPANAEAVYTTGPGQAVEYNYTRQGTYAEDYAQQSNEQNAVQVSGNPVAGVGGGASGAPPEWFGPISGGAANNPT